MYEMSGNLFKRCQELGRSNGLNIFLKSRDGSPRNAARITYNIYDYTTGSEVLLPPSDRIPVNPSIGEYYANFTIPIDANIGSYRIKWKAQEFTNSPVANIVQEFSVIADATSTVNLPKASYNEIELVKSLRVLLRDNNPARNYHFQPPTGEESINQFNRVFGFIWEDAELLEYLKVSLDITNMYPPRTFYATIDQLIQQNAGWRSLILTGAMVYALQALSINWTAEEFGYSIGGVSLDLEKSSKYQSMADSLDTRFKDMLSADTGAKATVKIIRGIQQSRYGIGIRSSFGPSVGRGALTPRRFVGL
jgi:hypothetical protein